MEQSVVDLWPDDITVTRQVAPVTILKQQASLLGQKTKNIVEGLVTSENVSGTHLAHQFYVVAPAMGNYQRRLFYISHDSVQFYPVKMIPDLSGTGLPEGGVEAATEDQFMARLGKILQSTGVKRVIQAILAQSQ